MDEVLTEDISSWYLNCWVLAPFGGRQTPCIVDGVNERVLHLTTYTGDSNTCYVRECEVWWPYLGAVNADGVALFVERKARRQWKRSFTGKGIKVTCPDSAAICQRSPEYANRVFQMTHSSIGTPLGRSLVKGLWHDEYYDLQLAYNLLTTGDAQSLAINRNVILTRADGGVKVWYERKLAGVLPRTFAFESRLPPRATSRLLKCMGIGG